MTWLSVFFRKLSYPHIFGFDNFRTALSIPSPTGLKTSSSKLAVNHVIDLCSKDSNTSVISQASLPKHPFQAIPSKPSFQKDPLETCSDLNSQHVLKGLMPSQIRSEIYQTPSKQHQHHFACKLDCAYSDIYT